MPLLDLPNELLLRVSWFLLKCPTCDCHHFTRNLCALANSSRVLHAVLTPYLLRTTEAQKILLWAINHHRIDTVALALGRGADLNLVHFERRYFSPGSTGIPLGTAIDIASRLRSRSTSAAIHQLKFDTIILLLQSGGKPTFSAVSLAARCGDLDLLELFLPHIVDINERHPGGGHTVLEVAGCCGNVQCMKLLLAAGADANGTGDTNNPTHYPPLRALSNAPIEVLQTLLDAGADATWEGSDGKSIVEDLFEQWRGWPGVDLNIDLLARYGSRLPRGEQAIALWQAPVWEVWTEADEQGASAGDRFGEPSMFPGSREYRGWIPAPNIAARELRGVHMGIRVPGSPGCKCPDCPPEKSGRTRDSNVPRRQLPGGWGVAI